MGPGRYVGPDMRRLIALLLLTAGCAASNGGGPGTGESEAASTDVEALVARYVDETLAERPGLGREVGLHEYDGRVPEIGEPAAQKAIARAEAYLEATDRLDLGKLPDPVRLDVQLTRLDARQTLFQLKRLRQHEKIMHYNSLFDVNGYLVRDYAPLSERVTKLLDHAEAATSLVDDMLATLDDSQVKTHLETAAIVYGGMISFYQNDVPAQAKKALEEDPELKARYEEVIPAAVAGMKKVSKWIEEHTDRGTDDFALGEESFLAMLRANEGLETTLPELEKMAQADFEKNRSAFEATAKVIDPNASVAEVARRVASERLPASGVLDEARDQVEGLKKFLVEAKIVSFDQTEKCTVKTTPPFMRWNSAFLDPAGPFEKAKGSFYYISPPDPSWSKEMQAQYIPWEGDLLATSIHEVYPGHFLHGLKIRNAPSRASKIFRSYAFTEGWAHYAEQMVLDEGYAGQTAGSDEGLSEREAKLKLGQLSNALLRNCRFLAAIGLHTKGMTVAEADSLFQNECFIDPGNAKQQAYRGTFDPGYLSYTLGKLQILALRDAYYEKKGKDLRAFHDWLLSYGAVPVSLIAERL